ncbi:MAG: FmdB family zinc ribbon protein [Acidobacteriota bacterium]
MPLYEYRCGSCGHAFETLRRMEDADCGVACPKCSGAVERQLSTFAPQMAQTGGASLAPCGQPASACGSGGCPHAH